MTGILPVQRNRNRDLAAVARYAMLLGWRKFQAAARSRALFPRKETVARGTLSSHESVAFGFFSRWPVPRYNLDPMTLSRQPLAPTEVEDQ